MFAAMPALVAGAGNGRARQPGVWRSVFIALAAAFVLTLVAPMVKVADQQASAEWSPPRTVYIPDTGQSLDQVFLDVWREGGGAEAYGYPITPEITLGNGHTVQYLQYARFEYWPEGDANGDHFVLGDIGEELRPFSLQRSFSGFTSTGNAGQHGSAATNAAFVEAWMPVDAPASDNDHIAYIEETDHTVRYAILKEWQNSGGVDYLGNPLTEQYVVDGITYQIFERGQIAWENGKEAWLVPVGQKLADKYSLDQDPTSQGDLPTYSEELFIPPEPVPPANGERWIEVNLSSQYLIAWQGDVSVLETYVSTGRPGFDTPAGTFHINNKVVSEDMEGVLGGEYYNVPNVPNTMYFTNQGHAIHGTYWHNNFGATMSHGCVNVPLQPAQWLFNWAPIGTRVVIHY